MIILIIYRMLVCFVVISLSYKTLLNYDIADVSVNSSIYIILIVSISYSVYSGLQYNVVNIVPILSFKIESFGYAPIPR